jgi:hypothetical protein
MNNELTEAIRKIRRAADKITDLQRDVFPNNPVVANELLDETVKISEAIEALKNILSIND